jgi:hypothetical protein
MAAAIPTVLNANAEVNVFSVVLAEASNNQMPTGYAQNYNLVEITNIRPVDILPII